VSDLVTSTRAVLDRAITLYDGSAEGVRLREVAARFDAPLRVAIAGKVKAGKSTLLNALVGEQLAPTDEGECTRIVTWYQDGYTYQVLAYPHEGQPRQLRFVRADGALEIDLGGLEPDAVDQLVVTWPSSALRTMTLIDTPGIGSLTESVSRRSWSFLSSEDEETPADAVLYLLKHLHAQDVDFLRAFHDVEVSQPNPINAIAVLSRADEIGVGRIDSMASARRIANRLGSDPKIRRLVQTVVPVAGLLAESAASLTEAEFRALKLVSEIPPKETERLLLSADRFVNSRPELALTTMEREHLLRRFGIFGVRLSAVLIRRSLVTTASELSKELRSRSGLEELRTVLRTLFMDRRDVLKARSALYALEAVVRTSPRPGSEVLASEVERIVAGAHPLNELRVLSGLRSGTVTGKADQIEELERIVGANGTTPEARLGLEVGTDTATMLQTLQETLARWQRRAENPLTSHEMATAARVAIRTLEGLMMELAAIR